MVVHPGDREPKSTGSPSGPPPYVPEENLWGQVEWGFYGPAQMSFLSIKHQFSLKAWNRTNALTLTSGLASSFLHPPSNSWWKGLCSSYASSQTPVPTQNQ